MAEDGMGIPVLCFLAAFCVWFTGCVYPLVQAVEPTCAMTPSIECKSSEVTGTMQICRQISACQGGTPEQIQISEAEPTYHILEEQEGAKYIVISGTPYIPIKFVPQVVISGTTYVPKIEAGHLNSDNLPFKDVPTCVIPDHETVTPTAPEESIPGETEGPAPPVTEVSIPGETEAPAPPPGFPAQPTVIPTLAPPAPIIANLLNDIGIPVPSVSVPIIEPNRFPPLAVPIPSYTLLFPDVSLYKAPNVQNKLFPSSISTSPVVDRTHSSSNYYTLHEQKTLLPTFSPTTFLADNWHATQTPPVPSF